MEQSLTVTPEGFDAYMVEYIDRAEAGVPGPLDRANSAAERAWQAADILSEDFAGSGLPVRAARVGRLARLTAVAQQRGEDVLALELAKRAELEAVNIEAFDAARFDGLNRPIPFRDGRGGAVTRWTRD